MGGDNMILKLYEPAYYRNLYSIEPEISILLQNLTTYYSDKEYSDSFNKISITTAIAINEVYSSGLWEEEVKCWEKTCDNEDEDNYNVTVVDDFDTSSKQWLEIELE